MNLREDVLFAVVTVAARRTRCEVPGGLMAPSEGGGEDVMLSPGEWGTWRLFV